MKNQKQTNVNVGDVRSEFCEIEKLVNRDTKESMDCQTLTKNMGGFFTLICC